jgi:hypothetical protein
MRTHRDICTIARPRRAILTIIDAVSSRAHPEMQSSGQRVSAHRAGVRRRFATSSRHNCRQASSIVRALPPAAILAPSMVPPAILRCSDVN